MGLGHSFACRRGARPAREQARKDQTDWEHGIVEKGAGEWTSGRTDEGGKKGGKKGLQGQQT